MAYKLRRNGWPRDQVTAQRRAIHPGSREARMEVEREWRELIDREVADMDEKRAQGHTGGNPASLAHSGGPIRGASELQRLSEIQTAQALRTTRAMWKAWAKVKGE